jgi:hypothetical protein
MSNATAALDGAIAQCDRLRTLLKQKRALQVWGADERAILKASALTWFNSHRAAVVAAVGVDNVLAVDAKYKELLAAGDKAASRPKLLTTLKSVRAALISIRSDAVSRLPGTASTDVAPPFAPLIADQQMQSILGMRWSECVKCLAADAPLAATVMMGGLLEAILLPRINREPNKSAIFTASTAPKDKAGKTKPLNEWMLKSYIEVVHERGWISVSAKDVGAVLRDYRNFVHPYKQLTQGIQLTNDDAKLLWEITKNVMRQVLGSAP